MTDHPTTSIEPASTPSAPLPMKAWSPSVSSVLALLQTDRPLTGKDIRTRSGLPRRTVYAALCVLRRRGLLVERLSLHDTRQTLFWLAAPVGVDSAAATPLPALGAPPMSAARSPST